MEQWVRLPDGRRLCYDVYGPEDGRVVLYFHGTPSSRKEPRILNGYGVDLDALLARSRIKLLAVDRPGMGASDPDLQGNLLSFAGDLHFLLQELGISKCPVLCWSGGGPFGLAMAWRYPETVSSVHIICGFSRQFSKEVEQQMGRNRWYFQLATRAPALLRQAMNLIRYKKIVSTVPRWITGLPHVDYCFLDSGPKLEILVSNTLKEAVRNGAAGAVYEARGYYRPMGFDLSQIVVPVHYWWGTMDMSVIRLHAEEVEQKVPGAVMHYRDGEGHLSLYVNHFGAVLQNIDLLI